MKKVLIAFTLVAFLGGTTFAATTFDGDPVKTEKTKGDEKKKKKKKKKKRKPKKKKQILNHWRLLMTVYTRGG